MSSVVAIASCSEEERIEKLGKYFRSYLGDWFTKLVAGVKYSPGVQRELALAMLEHAALALIANTDEAMKEDDEKTADRCLKVAREMLEILERHVHS